MLIAFLVAAFAAIVFLVFWILECGKHADTQDELSKARYNMGAAQEALVISRQKCADLEAALAIAQRNDNRGSNGRFEKRTPAAPLVGDQSVTFYPKVSG